MKTFKEHRELDVTENYKDGYLGKVGEKIPQYGASPPSAKNANWKYFTHEKMGVRVVVIPRLTKGRPGKQDKWLVVVLDKKDKIVKNIGSHPTDAGAEKLMKKIWSDQAKLHFK